MSDHIRINDRFTVSKTQPTIDDLKALKQQGFQSIVNLRTAEEDDQTLSPQAEGEQVQALGMQYLHFPVSSNNIDSQRVDQFRQETAELPEPILVHCHTGKRSGAFVMMDVAPKQGMSGEETIRKAEEMGFQCDVPQLENFVKEYVNSHQ